MGYIANSLWGGLGNRRAGASYTTEDLHSSIVSRDGLEELSWRNWCILSIISVAVTIGLGAALTPVFRTERESPWLWEGTEKVLLLCLAVMVSAALAFLTSRQLQLSRARSEMEKLEKEGRLRAERNAFRLYALLNVSKIMHSARRPESVLHEITRICSEVFDCHWSSLMLHDRKNEELVVKSVSGNTNMSKILGTRQKIGKGIAGWVAIRKKPLLLDPSSNLEEYLGPLYKSRPISAAMVVPIMHGEDLVGVLNVSSYHPETRYDDDDLCALQVFAENAGACIRSSQVLHAMKKKADILRTQPAFN